MTQTAIITGAASGIGRETAVRFARAGFGVGLIDRDADGLSETERLCRDEGSVARSVIVDLSDPVAVLSACALVSHQMDGICSVVHAAATDVRGTIEEMDAAEWDLAFNVNVRSAFLVCQALLPDLRRSGGGSIIFVSSVGARVAIPGISAYCSTKGAIESFARALSMELAADGIRVNCVAPTTVVTPRSIPGLTKLGNGSLAEGVAQLGRAHPLGKLATPEEIAEIIYFLAGKAASLITGSTVTADGGLLAMMPSDYSATM